MAESVFGLYKSELIAMRGPWRTVEDVELATLGWVHWWIRACGLGFALLPEGPDKQSDSRPSPHLRRQDQAGVSGRQMQWPT